MKSIEVKPLIDQAVGNVESANTILSSLLERERFWDYISMRAVIHNLYSEGRKASIRSVKAFYNALANAGLGRMGIKHGIDAFFPYYDMRDIISAYKGTYGGEQLKLVKRQTRFTKSVKPAAENKELGATEILIAVNQHLAQFKRSRDALAKLGISEKDAQKILSSVDM